MKAYRTWWPMLWILPVLACPLRRARAEDFTFHSNRSSQDIAPGRHFAAGVNYTGAQVRWRFDSSWAVEARWQHGKASSDYGDVTADVVGLRGYRFFRVDHPYAWYVGAECAHADAQAQSASYQVDGIAAGGFGGIELRVTRNIALGVDIGPYVLALKEKQTRTSQTSLDFVLNTGIVWYLF